MKNSLWQICKFCEQPGCHHDMFMAVCKHGMKNLLRKYVIQRELDKLGSNTNKSMVKQII